MAIAQPTHLRISIPSSGAPPGQVPAECFPGGVCATAEASPCVVRGRGHHAGGRGSTSVLTGSGVATTDLVGGGGGQQRRAGGGADRAGAICPGFQFAASTGLLTILVTGESTWTNCAQELMWTVRRRCRQLAVCAQTFRT